jgi:RNA polymerase sigma-70 factor (ECF subfamily)
MLVVSMRYLGSEDEAKDLLQEAYLKVFDKLPTYRKGTYFESWMKRIVVNMCIDLLRKDKNRVIPLNEVRTDSLTDHDEFDEIEWNHVLDSERERVLQAVKDLPPAYRAVFNLYVIEDYTHQEIAEMLGVSIGTSKSNLSKARQKLKNNLVKIHYKDKAL